jgi:hypothetical protein
MASVSDQREIVGLCRAAYPWQQGEEIMRRLIYAALGAALLGSLSACAGYHTVPPLDYTLPVEKPFERIAFDQAGDPYPASNDSSGLVIPPERDMMILVL